MWTNDDQKFYKVAGFPNSDGEPFGLTIKGRGKHVDSHNKVMDIINRLAKDKTTSFGDVKLTVTDKVKTNTILNAKVTLTTKDGQGQAEIKIHKPSDKRKQATIEIRKLTGHDYKTVEKIKDVITDMLDDFTSGESVSRIIAKNNAKPYTPLVRQPSLSVKLLCCSACEFKVKSVVALKQHMITTHKSPTVKCEICGFESNEAEVKDHKLEFHLVHQQIQKLPKRKKIVYSCIHCGITVDTKKKLQNHIESQHEGRVESSSSSEPSPPRKRPAKDDQVTSVDDSVLELMDKIIDAVVGNNMDTTENDNKDELIKAQALTIQGQAKRIADMEANVSTLLKWREEDRKVKTVESNSVKEGKPIPDHLNPVQEKHLKDLYGLKMKSDGNPGGDCLSSCTTMHLSNTKDSHERRRVNRRINLEIENVQVHVIL